MRRTRLIAYCLLPTAYCLLFSACNLGRGKEAQRPKVVLTPPSPDPEPPPAARPGFAVAFSPGGEIAARLREGRLELFDLAAEPPKERELALPKEALEQAQALALTTNRLALGYPDGSVVVYALDGAKKLYSLRGERSPTLLAFSPGGDLLLASDFEGQILVYDLAQGSLRHTLTGHKGGLSTLLVSPQGDRALSGSEDHSLRLWDLKEGKLLSTLSGHSRAVWSAAFLPDGHLAASASEDGSTRGWELTACAPGAVQQPACGRERFFRLGSARALATRPDGTRLLLVGTRGLSVLELPSGLELSRLELEPEVKLPRAASFAPDGRRALVFDRDGELKSFELPGEGQPELIVENP